MGARIERYAIVFGAALAAIVGIRACDLLFGCGCTWLWAGGDAGCNVHTPGVPHCPWCALGTAGFALVGVAIVGCEALVLAAARRRYGRRALSSLAAVTVGFVVGVVAAGWVALRVTGYPTFLGHGP